MTALLEAVHKTPKMLIADDDPGIVRLLAERCAKAGFDVQTASNGIQALLRANQLQPDILIIDVNMPKADGLSVCAHLLDPGRNSMNVIVISGRRDAPNVARCGGLGAFYMHKGPDFWRNLVSALTELFPNMAQTIRNMDTQVVLGGLKSRPSVLLIDDDLDVEKFYSSRLAQHGLEMLYASDSVNGYRMACKEEPNVIISDYFMPDGDALHLLWKLRTTPGTQKIPVLILSGRRLDESAQQVLKQEICGHVGAAAFFRKSFDTSGLFAAVEKYCSFEGNRTTAH